MQKQRAALLLTIVGALLCAAAVGGFVFYRFYLLRPYLFHPLAFAAAGGVALAVACVLGLRRPSVRWGGALVCVLGAGAVAFAGWFATAFQSDLTVDSRQAAPTGGMELVVLRGNALMAPDPVWELRVRTDAGLLSREYDLGCVNADMVSLKGIGWAGPGVIRAVLSDGIVDIAVDDAGRPARTVDGGC
ncbi:hypothetical protein [Mycolicibacterium neoaurum]|uniref:hypothetical protein n=1 Tax=Mycolicibacterium neoaurum TaxID=1795 RepID=UPI001F4C6959|nr:hypothetical protein [Mycolicibacterium neoaurum]